MARASHGGTHSDGRSMSRDLCLASRTCAWPGQQKCNPTVIPHNLYGPTFTLMSIPMRSPHMVPPRSLQLYLTHLPKAEPCSACCPLWTPTAAPAVLLAAHCGACCSLGSPSAVPLGHPLLSPWVTLCCSLGSPSAASDCGMNGALRAYAQTDWGYGVVVSVMRRGGPAANGDGTASSLDGYIADTLLVCNATSLQAGEPVPAKLGAWCAHAACLQEKGSHLAGSPASRRPVPAKHGCMVCMCDVLVLAPGIASKRARCCMMFLCCEAACNAGARVLWSSSRGPCLHPPVAATPCKPSVRCKPGCKEGCVWRGV